jgi:hypothetical protein
MRLPHDPLKIFASFDDPNLVSRAGLVPVISLAERAGLHALVRRHVQIVAKAGGVRCTCPHTGTARTNGSACSKRPAAPTVPGGLTTSDPVTAPPSGRHSRHNAASEPDRRPDKPPNW